MSDLLFIMGAPKTCTSSILGMLNCHPDIFIMYEAFMEKRIKSGEKILARHNISPHIINNRKSIGKIYNNINKSIGRNYKYFGDKWARIERPKKTRQWIEELKPHQVIFTVRDLRTWLCHDVVKSKQKLMRSENVIPNIIRYVYYFVKSFDLPTCVHVRLKDFTEDNDGIIDRIDNMLSEVSLRPYVEEWWNKMGKYDDPNKNIHKWWIPGPGRKRKSSFVKPEKLDISVTIKENDMWDKVLPIFDKYYNNCHGKFTKEEIGRDLNNLLNLKISPRKLDDCFTDIQAIKLGS